MAATLKEIDSGMYLNITECLKIFSTLPVTTCECERNVSALRRLKTYLRSTMSQTRLTGLALLHIHYNMDIDFHEIIRRFARPHPRRMQIANILSRLTPEARRGHFRQLKLKKFSGGACPWTPLHSCAFGARLSVKRSGFSLDPCLQPTQPFEWRAMGNETFYWDGLLN